MMSGFHTIGPVVENQTRHYVEEACQVVVPVRHEITAVFGGVHQNVAPGA